MRIEALISFLSEILVFLATEESLELWFFCASQPAGS